MMNINFNCTKIKYGHIILYILIYSYLVSSFGLRANILDGMEDVCCSHTGNYLLYRDASVHQMNSHIPGNEQCEETLLCDDSCQNEIDNHLPQKRKNHR